MRKIAWLRCFLDRPKPRGFDASNAFSIERAGCFVESIPPSLMVNFVIAAFLAFLTAIPIRRACRRGRMGAGVATGLVIMAFGFYVWAVPAVGLFFPNNRPVSAAFPLNAGGLLQEKFMVRTSENYDVELVCEAVEPFKSEWTDASSSKGYPTIECDIDVRIMRRGQAQEQAVLKSIRRSSQSGSSIAWSLGDAHLSPGIYELMIVNQKDLTRLAPTSPKVQMRIRGLAFKSRVIDYTIGLYVGAPILLLGLIIAAIGWFANAGSRAKSRSEATCVS